MKGFPAELIFVLIFVGMYLAQYVLKRRRSRAPQQPAQDAGAPQPPAGMFPDLEAPEEPIPIAWGTSRAPAEPLARPEPPAAPRTRPPRRYSRQGLMGTRRDVQNAVVIATVLGPCRALEPPGGAAAAATPRRSAG